MRSQLTRMVCPCGGNAWSLAELQAIDCSEEARKAWETILGPDDYYCSDEDDVLLRGEAKPR